MNFCILYLRTLLNTICLISLLALIDKNSDRYMKGIYIDNYGLRIATLYAY